MADSLGTIYAEIRLRLDNFKKDMATANAEIKTMQADTAASLSAYSEMGGTLKSVGGSMSKYITAPIVAMGTASVYMSTQFEQAMSSVKAVSEVTGEEFQQLKDFAMEMGAETKFSALEAANAMFELTKLGFDANEILSALPATLDMAAAGGVELADAATIVATSMNMFNEDAEATGRYADVFAKAAAMGALDVQTLGEALSYAGPSAAAMGYTLEETAAMLAVFSDAGIDSTRAGTTFEAMMRDMKKNALDNGGALMFMNAAGEEVSVSMYNAAGKIRPMIDIIADLSKATAGMSDAQRDAALAEVANTQGLRGLNVLLAKGPEYLAQYTDAINSSAGAGDSMASVMQDNLAGSLEQLKGSLETAGIALGEILAPVIRELADSLKIIVDAFGQLPKGVQTGIVIFLALVAVLGPLLFIVGAFLAMIPAMTAGFAAISAAAAPVLVPILAIIAAIAAVIVIVYLLIKNWDTVKAFFVKLWDNVKQTFSSAMEAIKGFFSGIGDWFATQWNKVKEGAQTAWNGVKNVTNKVFGSVTSTVREGLDGMKQAFQENGGGIKGALAATWSGVKSYSMAGLNILNKLTGGKLGELFKVFKEKLASIWQGIKDWVASTVATIKALPAKIGAALLTFFTQTLPYAIGYGLGVAVGFVRDTVIAVIEWFATLPERISLFLTTAWTNIQLWAQNLWTTMTTWVSTTIEAVSQFFAELPGKIWAWLQLAWTNVSTWATNLWTTMTTWTKTAIDDVVTFFSELPEKVWTWLVSVVTSIGTWGQNLWTSATEAATQLWTGFVDVIMGLPDKVGEIFTQVVDTIANFGTSLLQGAEDVANNIWNGFKDGLGINSPSYIEEAMTNIMAKSKETLGTMKNDFNALGRLTVQPSMSLTPAFAGAVNPVMREEVVYRHEGTVTLKGVTNKEEFVGSVDAVMDEMRRSNRR